MSESVTPSRKQTALQLTCAIVSNPNITGPLDPEEAADQALQLLNYLEQRLKAPQTRTRPEG